METVGTPALALPPVAFYSERAGLRTPQACRPIIIRHLEIAEPGGRSELWAAGAAKETSLFCHSGDFSHQHPRGPIAPENEREFANSFRTHFGLEQGAEADDDPIRKE